MLAFLIRRVLTMVLTALCLTFVVFYLTNLPPNLEKLAKSEASARMSDADVESWLESNGFARPAVVRMLAASYSQYQRAAQRWWSGIEPVYVKATQPRRPPVYFVSSNTHALANLVADLLYARFNPKIRYGRSVG